MTAAVVADDRLCGARTRSAGGRACRNPAGKGTSHVGTGRCRMHAGSTPSHLIAAEVVVAERALRTLGEAIPTDPLEGLQRAVDSAAGLHHGLQQLVREAAASDDSRALVPRLALYADAIDRLARTAKQAVEAKLTERQAALTSAQGTLLVEVVMAALTVAAIPRELHLPLRRALAAEIDLRIERGETTQ